LKKKNQKNFSPFAGVIAGVPVSPPDRSQGGKVFLVLFFQKKNRLLAFPTRGLPFSSEPAKAPLRQTGVAAPR
jgi:hypothetical protein